MAKSRQDVVGVNSVKDANGKVLVENDEVKEEWSKYIEQEAQLMLTTGSTRLAVSRGQQTWYHSTCYIWFPIVQ